MDSILQIIRSTRDFIHDINNKLMVAGGYSQQVKEDCEEKLGMTEENQTPTMPDGEEKDALLDTLTKLKKVEKSLSDIETMCKKHREYLIHEQEVHTPKNSP